MQLVRMLFGSHVYGTMTPTSDHDYKGVFVPAGRDLLFQRACKVSQNTSTGDPEGKNTPDDVDEEHFSIQGFLKLLCDGQTIAVDMLFVPSRHYYELPNGFLCDPLWSEIVANREALISRKVSGFVGYCRQQANKYGIKGSRMAAARAAVETLGKLDPRSRLQHHWDLGTLAHLVEMEHCELLQIPHRHTGREVAHLSVCGRKAALSNRVSVALEMYQNLFDRYGARARAAEQNDGIDWKALMHAVRVLGQAKELLTTSAITFPRPDATRLVAIRHGAIEYNEVAAEIERGVEELELLKDQSDLPEEPDRELADDIVEEAHLLSIAEAYTQRSVVPMHRRPFA